MDDSDFQSLVRRVRAGDPAAAGELVRRYEPEIRRVVRVRLVNRELQRAFDSMDVCQSVFANFFVRVAGGELDLGTPDQLVRVLIVMARNKLTDLARRHRARKRAGSHRRADPGELDGVAAGGPTPGSFAADAELLAKARDVMTAEERYLADQRAAGREWADLAAELGCEPDAVRKRHKRAIERVVQQLGLDDD